jgi:thiol:disulfide interchange protein DsbD
MKSRFLILALFAIVAFALPSKVFAQGTWSDKVSWTYKIQKIDDKTAYVIATAKLINGWHVFSVNHDPMKADFTGYATEMKLVESPNFKAIGKLKDGQKAHVHVDDLGEQLYFEGTASFKQKIEILTDKPFDIKFAMVYQICDVNGCMFPPEKDITLKVSGFDPNKTDDTNGEDESMVINGDFAKDKDGNEYVMYLNEWVKVPEGNSAKFYKNYLELGGTYENE